MSKKYQEEYEVGYTPRLVMEEASRCLLCLDAPCSSSCPAGTDPAKFIRSLRFKNVKGAAETVRINNILGAICARVCPTERYCQAGCSRSGIDKPIDIGRIQRYITDFEDALDMEILEDRELNGKRVAVVGSGPAGLTTAAELAKRGHKVTIYEKDAKAGGYLRYGIPEYRLPNEVVDKEINRIVKLGVDIVLNTRVGEDVKFEDLRKDNDAVVLAVGASEGKMLPMFENNCKVIKAVDWLKKVKSRKGNVKVPENVMVIGGGDVAYEKFLHSEVERLSLKNVKFTGFLNGEAKDKALASCSVLAMPSEFENFGNVVVEGLVRSIPCIATMGSPWEELNTRQCGWWIPFSQDSITEAVAAALEATDEDLHIMGINGRRLVEERYSVDAVGGQMMRLYQWVCGNAEKPEFVY